MNLQVTMLQAARTIEDGVRGDLVPPEALALLEALGCPPGASVDGMPRQRAAIFRAAAQCSRLFRLHSRDAPGLAFFGAEADPAEVCDEPLIPPMSACGTGVTQMEAFAACIGEAVERVSQVETADDRMVPPVSFDESQPSACINLLPQDRWIDGCLLARKVIDDGPCLVPIDLCFRRAPPRRCFEPPFPLSIGCAAGVSVESAILHGLLELIERDAVALWWRGGRRGRPLSPQVTTEVESLITTLRQGISGRSTWVVDITTDIGVPVVAAISFEPTGRGFCCGMAARPSFGAAARSALFEMCQGELAHQIVVMKRSALGDAALNWLDEAHLRRFSCIDARDCPIVHPSGTPTIAQGLDSSTPRHGLESVTRRLASLGFDPVVVDITRPRFSIPVMRLLCPGLEQEPSPLRGERLRAAIDETGGGPGIRTSISLA
jgi:ribosomal protein S12 methylthiotransferase accessory factor